MPLLVCRTCPRYDTTNTGRFRTDIQATITTHPDAADVDVRYVQCLGGCPADGVAAVDGPGKARVRFTGLNADDADALVRAARAHADCATGAPEDWEIPAELADRLSAITIKRGSRMP